MYIISKLTGNIYLNGIKVPLDDSTQEFQQYLIDKDIVGVEYVEATPEEIAEQQHYKIEEIKKFQYQELSPTDWYYTRFLETGQEVPLEIIQQRQQIGEKYNNLTNEINNE